MAILNLTDDEYRKLDAINASTLKHYVNSIKEGNKYLKNPFKGSSITDAGTMIHSYVLEPDLFHEQYSLFNAPVNEKTGKEFGKDTIKYKNAKEEFQKCDKLAYSNSDNEMLENIINNIYKCKDSTNLLKKCDKRELVLTWIDDDTGLNCKG